MLTNNQEAMSLWSGGMSAALPNPWLHTGAEYGNLRLWMLSDTDQALRALDLQRQAAGCDCCEVGSSE